MSDTKGKEEASRDMPLVVNDSQQLVDARGQPQASSVPVPVEETVNHVEIGKVAAPEDDRNEKPEAILEGAAQQEVQNTLHSVPVEVNTQILVRNDSEHASDLKTEVKESLRNTGIENDANACENHTTAGIVVEVKPEACDVLDSKKLPSHIERTAPQAVPADTKTGTKNGVENKANEKQETASADNGNSNSKHLFFLDADHSYDGNESGTDEEQSAFMKELENFFKERSMEFKPPKFYGEGLNCLNRVAVDPTAQPSQNSSFLKLFKQQNRAIQPSIHVVSYSSYDMYCSGLWRAVTRLGGYDKVTSCKLWRQVGESFKPPKTCTTVSWTFRGFYEKALLDYERLKTKGGELTVPIASHTEPLAIENQASASGRARRDAAARAMQGWHSQRLLANGEVSDPIIKDRNSMSLQKREKQLKSINLLKRKKPSYMDNAVKAARSKPSKPQLDTSVIDIGPPADWVKINVQKTKDCFEVYALVPGLLREEVRVQSDPAGRLVISGEPEHPDNPWGVTPFRKIVNLPSRIDPHHTSAVVTLHGQLFVRVPFEQSE